MKKLSAKAKAQRMALRTKLRGLVKRRVYLEKAIAIAHDNMSAYLDDPESLENEAQSMAADAKDLGFIEREISGVELELHPQWRSLRF